MNNKKDLSATNAESVSPVVFSPPYDTDDQEEWMPLLREQIKNGRKSLWSRTCRHFRAVGRAEAVYYWFDEEIKCSWKRCASYKEEVIKQELLDMLGERTVPDVLGGEGYTKVRSAKIYLASCGRPGYQEATLERIRESISFIVAYQFCRAFYYSQVMRQATPGGIEYRDIGCPFNTHSYPPVKMMQAAIIHMALGHELPAYRHYPDV